MPATYEIRPLSRPAQGLIPTFEQYVSLIDRYNDLLHEYRELDRRTSQREKAYKALKKSFKDWDQYIKRKQQTSGREQGILVQPVTPQLPSTTPAPVDTALRAPSPEHGHGHGHGHQPTKPSRLRETVHVFVDPRLNPSHSTTPTLRITSSQTTQGDLSSDGPQVPNDDDIPEVVSARSLKRKRESVISDHLHEQRAGSRDGTPDRPFTIKEERNSSPVTSRFEHLHLLRTETSDLDSAIAPIKREVHLPHVPVLGRRHASSSPSPSKDTTTPSGHTSHDAAPTPYPRPASDQRATALRNSAGPLQPLSTNTPTLPRTSTVLNDTTPKSHGKKSNHGAGAIHILSEDGDNPPRTVKKSRLSSDDVTPKNNNIHRLSNLLEGAAETPTKTVLSPRKAPSVRKTRDQVLHPVAQPVEQTATRTRRTIRDKVAVEADRQPDGAPGPVLPEHESLRSRPLHRLNIDDFKVDPKYDEVGFAYSESVRKREDRRCLPGCTKDCCGAIRRLAAAGILPNVPRRRGLFDDPDADIDDDELTLQGYLGRGYAQVIRNASADEKKQMLIDARTKAFADKHGKHRQTFERRTTPPGFWRTEMPTTQEMEQDREEARRMERQKIEERWREAMRGGGRYSFRDE